MLILWDTISNLSLFSKKGDPSHYLIHAEQQVIDWFNWIEKNNPYARQKLPNISNPKAFVVIGRTSSLDEMQRIKLQSRNSLFNSKINIMTYDDLLEKAKRLLGLLQGAFKINI